MQPEPFDRPARPAGERRIETFHDDPQKYLPVMREVVARQLEELAGAVRAGSVHMVELLWSGSGHFSYARSDERVGQTSYVTCGFDPADPWSAVPGGKP